MRKYNRLIRKGWKPIVVDTHSYNGLYWTNILMAKSGERKTLRLDGIWELSALVADTKEKE